MKTPVKYLHLLGFLMMFPNPAESQADFSPEAYMEYRESHRNYTASELIGDHPPKTTYYESRQYPADLSVVPWYDSLSSQYSFTGDEQELLKQNYFMVTERLAFMDWAMAFINLYSNDMPLFLSTDFILSTLHNSYDAILQIVEWQFLEPNLQELLFAMYDHVPVLAARYDSDSRFDEVLKDVDLYVAMARSLAEGKEYLPQVGGREKFDELMAAAMAGEDMVKTTLFTETRERKIDFSQFKPRGHYNKDIYTRDGVITLENYFRAMMWLGRIDFLLTAPPENPWEPDWTDEELRRMQLGALLLNEILYDCGKIGNLEKHEEIISFMVGPDDNMTPGELLELSNRELVSPSDLFDESVFNVFMEEINGSDDYGQKIMSNFFFVNPDTCDPGQLPVSYKILGQKFLVDSYVFSEVVYDRIVSEGVKVHRPLPDPLDAMAALGNEDAMALLEGEMEKYKYAPNMAGLQYLIDSYDEEFWEQSMYNTWLSAIKSLNPLATANGLPYFMQTAAWHHEKLNTQLTSWAQLRHDNILYGKQSYTGGTGCSFPYVYVEPYPALYEKLALFASMAADFFGEALSGTPVDCREQIVAYYTRYEEIMQQLGEITVKELKNQPLSDQEVTFLKTMISDMMVSGPSITGWYTDLFFDVQKGLQSDFTVADVHTQPTDEFGVEVGNVLHVGNGLINLGIFIAGNPCDPKGLMAFAGPVSSFHVEVQAGYKRLTDQDWEEYFWYWDEPGPERPDWVAKYLVNKSGNLYEEGRELKGELYQGNGMEPGSGIGNPGYMILFPNPAADVAGVRFILDEATDFRLEIYDTTGRLMYRRSESGLAPAEHHVSLPVAGWQRGLYLVKATFNGHVVTKELLLQ
jgi:hypothetical protein